MEKIATILPKVLHQKTLHANAAASEVLHEAEKYLQEIFGSGNVGKEKNISGHKIQHGLLFFEVSSSAWNNRLFLEKMNLVEYLQKKFPNLMVKDVRGIVTPMPAPTGPLRGSKQ